MAMKMSILLLVLGVALFQNVNAQGCPGCPWDGDVNDPEVIKNVKQVLAQKNADDVLIKVLSVKHQIVAGEKQTVTFEARNARTNETKICTTSYVLQPWISKSAQVLEFQCRKQ
ncbi:hypothetical protein O3M35_013110 [Rhynocoris fuscipes]|uniref:Cystatin domain-containing protein n=1 Tax=Rhynocoris fuscipes TaxID=488301 RepID=A0AAW1CK92_9HEMI